MQKFNSQIDKLTNTYSEITKNMEPKMGNLATISLARSIFVIIIYLVYVPIMAMGSFMMLMRLTCF